MLDSAARDEIDRLAKVLEPELVAFRRDLHRHPEVGRQEHRTTATIMARLSAAGLAPRVLTAGTGLVCDVAGSAGVAPSIGFRADLDALPLQDLKSVEYRSEVDGVCHACGHDAHAAVALGTALVLAELSRIGLLRRSARIIFQPAEETIPGGALDVIAEGALSGLEQLFAFHCDPATEVGRVGLRAGPITAGADGLRVTLTGPGGHTARPHLTADLVYALGVVVTQLPGALSRLCDPRAGLSVVFGQVHAGTAANAVPRSGYVDGTVRCLDADLWEAAHGLVPDLVESLVSPYGVDVTVDLHASVPPCVNDPRAVDAFRSAAVDLLGADAVAQTRQSLGGEDFAWMTNLVPGALVRLGVRSREVADLGDLHQGRFDIDEAAICLGVRLFSAVCATVDDT